MGSDSYLELVLADGFRLARPASELRDLCGSRADWLERFAHNASGWWPINCSSWAPVDSFETLRIISAKMVRHWLALIQCQPGCSISSNSERISAERERFIELCCPRRIKSARNFALISSGGPEANELRGKLCPSTD